MRHFTSLYDVDSVPELLQQAQSLKEAPFSAQALGRNRSMALIFLNPSLRTRLSTQKAAQNLGIQTMVMNMGAEGWQLETDFGVVMDGKKAEHVKEAAAVIGSYVDLVGIRSFPQLQDRREDEKEVFLSAFRQYSGVPVISLESATLHPLQSLADLMTIEELKTTSKPQITMSWAPHVKPLPHAVPHSFAQWALHQGLELTIAQPKGYELDPAYTQGATISHNQEEALQGADFVYAKSWAALSPYGQMPEVQENWCLDGRKMALTQQAWFLHCLPLRRNLIATDEVLDGPRSAVIQQAENRLWTAQAVLKQLLTDNYPPQSPAP